MEFLKRRNAPIQSSAWDALDEEAARTLKGRLVGRRIVDVEGPKGWGFSAIDIGRLEIPDQDAKASVQYGMRRVQPLVEARARFALSQWELDDIARGCADPDLDPLVSAAREIADFEDRAILEGFSDAGIVGLRSAATNDALKLGKDPALFPTSIAEALIVLRDASVGGPYALVLGRDAFTLLEGGAAGYPPLRKIEKLLDGPVLYSPVLEGGVLVSTRGGDFELTLGQDFALGYETHDVRELRLFFTESFSFRVLEPAAIVPLD